MIVLRNHRDFGNAIALSVGLAVAATCALMLAGWRLESAILHSVTPELPTKADAAVGMLLCGVALALLSREKSGKASGFWVKGTAVAAIVLGALTLGDYLPGYGNRITPWLFRHMSVEGKASQSGRMPAATAFSFVLTGVSLFMAAQPIATRRKASIGAGLSLAVMLVALLALAGSVLGEVFNLGSWNYTGMAAPAAGGFILLGIGLLALPASEGTLTWCLDFLTTGGFAAGIVALAGTAGISYHFTSQLQATAALVAATQEALKEISDVTAEVASVGSSQRSYVNTGDGGYLEQEVAAKASLHQELDRLRELMAKSPEQQSELDRLGGLIGQRIGFGERTIAARRQNGLRAAEQLIASGEGIAISENIRRVIKDLEQEEYSLLEQRREIEQTTSATTFLALPMGMFLSVTLLSIGLFSLNAGVSERVKTETRARWLASFPERDPNPIVELDLEEGSIDYRNPFSMQLLPDLAKRGLGHPWLSGLNEAALELIGDGQRPFRREITMDGRYFAQTLNYIQETGRVRVYGTEITELKQVAATAARLAAIVEGSDDAILGEDLQGIVTSWNGGAEKTFGYEAREIVGQPIARLLPPGRREEEEEIISGIKRGESMPQFETQRLRKDGTAVCVSITASPIKDSAGKVVGASKVARDITERLRSEEALRASEERFRQFAESISEAFWIAAADHSQLLYISPAYEKIWGRTRQSLYEKPSTFMEAVYWEDRDQTLSAFQAVSRGEDFDLEHRIVGPHGQIRWVRTRGAAIRNEGGAVYRVAGIAEDISRRKETEHQLRQAQKMETIGQLAGGVAHDFNNVVTVIGANLELLLATEKNLSPAGMDYLDHIHHAATVATTLNRQLLAFSRDEAMRLEVLDLNKVVASFTKMLRRIVGENIQVRSELLSDLPPVKADPGMIEQALMNLAVNARDAMPHGGQLVIGTEVALISDAQATNNPRRRAGRHVCLTVRDTGTGIAEEIIPRIFEPFFTTKVVGKGTGLGLATVFAIAEQHNGWIEVSSEVKMGTTFSLYLPIAREHLPESIVAPSPEVIGGAESILLVEDDRAVRSAMLQALRNYGYSVVAAGTGVAAQTLWEEHDGQFDLLLTDMVMPGGITGLELAGLLRAEKPDLKVILTSGYSSQLSGRDLAKDKGITLVHKPFSLRVLAETVRQRLDA